MGMPELRWIGPTAKTHWTEEYFVPPANHTTLMLDKTRGLGTSTLNIDW